MRFIIFMIALSVLGGFGLAQGKTVTVQDLETSFNIDAGMGLGKHWDIGACAQLRLNQNSSSLDRFYAGLGGEFHINRMLGFGALYRFHLKQASTNSFEGLHQISLDFNFKLEVKRLGASYRLRFENDEADFFSGAYTNASFNLRNRFKVEYDIKEIDLKPFAAAEIYYQFGGEVPGFNKAGLSLGAEYSFNKHISVGAGYGVDIVNKSNYVRTLYSLELNNSYKF